MWSDELFAESLDRLSDRDNARAARAEFNRMRTDVTAGQYLDIVAEASWPHVREGREVDVALNVITYKSAKYSIEAPLAIGASLGGASLAQMAALREFGLPLGIAFQLRDDLLGVYGDSELTGKPTGDDLVEGKRTVLIALARQGLPASARRTVDELLGDAELTDEQILTLQETIRASGAIERGRADDLRERGQRPGRHRGRPADRGLPRRADPPRGVDQRPRLLTSAPGSAAAGLGVSRPPTEV